MILGCDASGVDESTGDEVVVHSVINQPGWTGDDTVDPKRSLLSEKHQGSLAEYVVVPTRNVVPKPAEFSFGEAACLSTAWLTAYRMLFTKSGLRPGQSVLVQGASGGVATACISMARAAGMQVFATARTEAKRAKALELGAHESFESGARLPAKVDAVMETVGEGDLLALGQVAETRRPDRHLRRDVRPEPAGRPESILLPAARTRRLDDGDEGRADRSDRVPARDRRAPDDRPHHRAGRHRIGPRGDGVRRPRRQDRRRTVERRIVRA